jgi:K+-transporting ATPase KdpF subunit
MSGLVLTSTAVAVALVVLGYLLYTLVRPERF